MMNLVLGATGMVGGEICRNLAAIGESFRVLVRSTSDRSKVAELKNLGAEIVQGDLRDRSSLEVACQGIRTVFSTVSSMPFSVEDAKNDIDSVDLQGMTNLISAAQTADVPRFIYTSLSAHIDLDFPLRNAKRAVEQRLIDSGLVYTILRPSYFMEVWFSPVVGFDTDNAKVSIYGNGERAISWISYRDVAKFAVSSLDESKAQNAIFELGSPEALSPHQVVRIFEKASGRVFDLHHIAEETLRAQKDAARNPIEQSFAGLMLCYAQGDAIDMQATLNIFPLQLTSVREYVQSVVPGSAYPTQV